MDKSPYTPRRFSGKSYTMAVTLTKQDGLLINIINNVCDINWGRSEWGCCLFIVTGEQLIRILGQVMLNDLVKVPTWEDYTPEFRTVDVRPND